ncbi:MAG TPA: hypothetical protein VGN32_07490 [Ktedonobacterales bacterium]|jgi:hypothetical protein|nr:hypothetical protein [Ktedonobacterales bacterium]
MRQDALSLLHRRIGETVAWCAWQPFVKNACTLPDLAYIWHLELAQIDAPRIGASPPVSVLRTPELEPPNFFADATTFLGRRIGVEMLAKSRALLLRERDAYPADLPVELGRGRFLLYDPNSTDEGGAALAASAGFFTGADAPPWDTWIMFLQETSQPVPGAAWASYLVSWVPPNLVEVAAAGMAVCPMGCIAWADECDTAITRFLRSANLLR